MSKKQSKKKNKHKAQLPIQTSYRYSIVKCKSNLSTSPEFGNAIIPANVPVIIPNELNTGEHKIKITSRFEDHFKPLKSGSKLHNKHVLIVKYGDMSDIIATLFGIAELKTLYPTVKISFLSSIHNSSILKCFPRLIDNVLPAIVPFTSHISKIQYIAYLDDIYTPGEFNTLQETYAYAMGVKPDENILDFILSQNIALTDLERNGIGIQYNIIEPIANYNIEKVIELINKVFETYPEERVYLLGEPKDYVYVNYIQSKTSKPIITNGCGSPELSASQVMTLISSLKCVIGGDGPMLQMAGVTETPMIGLFGSFNSDKKISHYRNAIGINGRTECSPCNNRFPVSYCAFNNGEGLCINSITSDDIMFNLKNIIGN